MTTTIINSSSKDGRTGGGGEQSEDYPVPTGREEVGDEGDTLPDSPNYPWGGNSPVHRRPVREPAEGAAAKRDVKQYRWERLGDLFVNSPNDREAVEEEEEEGSLGED